MSQLIPFDSGKVPAHLRAAAAALVSNLAPSGGGGGFPTISLKGKVFHLKRGDSKELITNPNDPDTPASSLEVVIIDAGPGAGKNAKVYYAEGYVEGSDGKPDCYSNNGVEPEADAQSKQSNKCAICAHNIWGSGQGGKGRACADSKRLAIAPAGAINDAMMLRVPAGSLAALRDFDKVLTARGVSPQMVVTKIGFDYSVAHPALTFKPVGFVDEGTLSEVMTAMQSDVVKQIIGSQPVVRDEESFEQPAPAPVTKPAAKPVPKVEAPKAEAPKPAAKPAPEADDLPTTPRTKVKVEEDEAPPAPKKAAPKVAEVSSDLDAALDDLDFDM